MPAASWREKERRGKLTYGAFSNALPAVLPNGWEFSISNERFQARLRIKEALGESFQDLDL